MSKEPLNKSIASLRNLKHTVARRTVQLMTVVLGKQCTAANLRLRPRPGNLSRRNALKLSSTVGIAALLPRATWALCGKTTDAFFQLDSIAQAALLKQGEVSPVDLTQAAIKRIKLLNDQLNAVITPIFEPALERAQNGLPSGPFSGVPYLFKDLMEYKGYRTAFGSRASINHISDHTHVFGNRVLEAGMNVLGKTNTPELGLLGTTEPLAFGPTPNPWDLSRSSGGSSGGAAAAVAAGMVASAQGSDGGGSLRVPASCCGVFALKPSRGREVRTEPPMPWELSVKGHITRTVRDSAALFAVTENKGSNAHFPAIGFTKNTLNRKLKIGLVMHGINGKKPSCDVEAQILATAKLCQDLGHDISETSFQFDSGRLIDAFLAMWSSHAANFKAHLEKQTGASVGEDLLEPWTLYMAEYFHTRGQAHMQTAQSYFAEVTENLDDMMQKHDVLLSPVLSTAAPKLGEQGPLVAGDQLIQDALNYVNYTPVYNISGQPAMSVPLGWNAKGLPVGSQFAARKGNEKTLFEFAYQLEEARSWHQRWAPHSAAQMG